MIAMEILGKIKRLYFRDKKSLHDIAPLTGLSRNTIRKWVREPLGEEALKYVRQDMPSKLAAYHAEIERALKADSHRTKQNRRTAKALLYKFRREAIPVAIARRRRLYARGVARKVRPSRRSCHCSLNWARRFSLTGATKL